MTARARQSRKRQTSLNFEVLDLESDFENDVPPHAARKIAHEPPNQQHAQPNRSYSKSKRVSKGDRKR